MRFVGAFVLAALDYVGMAREMVDAAGAHSPTFQPGIPWHVTIMATGSGWASVVVAPLAVLGAVLALRSPPARGAVLGLVAAVVLLWAVLQSAALSERFFVWLVPGVGYLVAAAVARVPAASVLGAGGAALALTGVLPDYTSEPTGYRQAAALVRRVDRSGGRSCVVGVGVGVPPMLGYLDARRQFEVVTDPGQLDRYDVVVVASWWPRRPNGSRPTDR